MSQPKEFLQAVSVSQPTHDFCQLHRHFPVEVLQLCLTHLSDAPGGEVGAGSAVGLAVGLAVGFAVGFGRHCELFLHSSIL